MNRQVCVHRKQAEADSTDIQEEIVEPFFGFLCMKGKYFRVRNGCNNMVKE